MSTGTRKTSRPRATPSSHNPLSGKLFLVDTPQGCHICIMSACQLTVPAFNSCTKYMGRPGIIRNRTVSWAWMRSHVTDLTTEFSSYSKDTWVIDMFGLWFWHVIHGRLYSQALADVRPTGAGIKCLHCTCTCILENLHSFHLKVIY